MTFFISSNADWDFYWIGRDWLNNQYLQHTFLDQQKICHFRNDYEVCQFINDSSTFLCPILLQLVNTKRQFGKKY